MSQMRDEAEALAGALEFGFCTVAEAVRWSDLQILREDLPHPALFNVSLARDCYPQDVVGMLRQLPGTPDHSRVNLALLTILDFRLKAEQDQAYRIAIALYDMVLAGHIADPRLKEIGSWAWDLIDLAGTELPWETRKETIEEMSAALNDVAQSAAVKWPVEIVSEHQI